MYPFPDTSLFPREPKPAPRLLHPREWRLLNELMCKRRERAMDIEYAIFHRRYSGRALVLQIGSDAVVALDRVTKKTVAHRIVRLDP